MIRSLLTRLGVLATLPVTLMFTAGPATTPAMAQAVCPDGAGPAVLDRPLPQGDDHDAALLDRAVLIETNRARCDRGLRPLAANASLRRSAELHSRDMARLGFFSHASPVRGRETLSARIEQVGFRWTRLAENIIEAHYMAYRNGAQYYEVDAATCRFTYTDGSPIPAHTYASLAREVVRRWMQSPGHRDNILTPELTGHGFAIARNASRALCGGLYGTQVLAR